MAPDSRDSPEQSRDADPRVPDRYRISEPSPGVVVIYDVEDEAAWIRSETPVDLADAR
jgi:hypothetical protein